MTTEITAKKDTSLLKKATAHVRQLLTEELPDGVHFHNFELTKDVRKAAGALAKEANLSNAEKEALFLAALFHNTGRTNGGPQYWEESKRLASEFLQAEGAEPATIVKVNELIGLVAPDAQPADQLGKLFVDARFGFYGNKKFQQRIKRLRKQKEELKDDFQSDIEWEMEKLERLKHHVFLTPEAESLFGKRKQKNQEKAKKQLKSLKKERKEALEASSVSANSGARTMFKTALRNHIDLTAIADQKANIMLSINALIFTIGLPAFSTYLTGTIYLIVPGAIFLFTSVATMALATLATRPIKMDGETDLAKLRTGKTNLFFFGNFYNVSQTDYQDAIREIVADRDYLDTSFINDLYFLGLSLGDKYKRLRICYTVFFSGLLLSTLAFVLGYLFLK